MSPMKRRNPKSAKAIAARAMQLLDGLPLECDGASRALSIVLQHVGVEHELHVGSCSVEGAGRIPLHWWVVLPDGAHCDIRARMWLGEASGVPHGVFHPGAAQRYESRAVEVQQASPVVFWVLTSMELQAFVDLLGPEVTVS